MEELVYLSLGTNLGDREANLAGAISAIETIDDVSNIRGASFYDSSYVGEGEQPNYLNTVVECLTSLNPFEFFDQTCKIESMMGRPKIREKYIARSIDIDILCHGESVLETDTLTIPHPGIPYRKFVLIPFNELDPDYIIPGWKISVKNLLHTCADTSSIAKHNIESEA